jgi:lysophospholipid acyltransferase (LPLAT)-like uncharacterized protein
VKPAVYAVLGIVLGLFARMYLSTLRVSLSIDPSLDRTDRRPWILCFWHGGQLPLLGWRRRRTTVALVSHSLDGQMQARALVLQGLVVERGSTSRGGARGLLAIVRRLKEGEDAAFAVDGPHGPRGNVKPGAGLAARLSGGMLVPMGSAAPRGMTLERAWDKLRIPMPFSRVGVCLGAPLEGTASADEIAEALERAAALASETLRVVASPAHAVLHHARRT